MYFPLRDFASSPPSVYTHIIIIIIIILIDASAARVTTWRGRAVWAHRRVCGGRARQKARTTET